MMYCLTCSNQMNKSLSVVGWLVGESIKQCFISAMRQQKQLDMVKRLRDKVNKGTNERNNGNKRSHTMD